MMRRPSKPSAVLGLPFGTGVDIDTGKQNKPVTFISGVTARSNTTGSKP
jgi:hypothetical protein